MKMKSWSYSKIKTYETCPAQLRFRLDGIPEPPSPAMDRGTEKHEQLEHYITGVAARLPKELSDALGELRHDIVRLRKHPSAEAEVEVAVDRRWRAVAWNSPNAWLRAKFDVRVPDTNPSKNELGTRIIDHKTGRERPSEHSDQLELYTVMEFSINKTIDYVIGEIYYVDHGRKMSALYDNRQLVLNRLRDRWIERAEKMLADRRMEPKPGYGCKWCAFSRTKGGPCEAA